MHDVELFFNVVADSDEAEQIFASCSTEKIAAMLLECFKALHQGVCVRLCVLLGFRFDAGSSKQKQLKFKETQAEQPQPFSCLFAFDICCHCLIGTFKP
eukprot:5333107-Amphidinium_carterae.2